MSVFVSAPYYFNYCSFVRYPKVRDHDISVFFSINYVCQAYLSVLKAWTYIGGVLWGSVVQLPRAKCPRILSVWATHTLLLCLARVCYGVLVGRVNIIEVG